MPADSGTRPVDGQLRLEAPDFGTVTAIFLGTMREQAHSLLASAGWRVDAPWKDGFRLGKSRSRILTTITTGKTRLVWIEVPRRAQRPSISSFTESDAFDKTPGPDDQIIDFISHIIILCSDYNARFVAMHPLKSRLWGAGPLIDSLALAGASHHTFDERRLGGKGSSWRMVTNWPEAITATRQLRRGHRVSHTPCDAGRGGDQGSLDVLELLATNIAAVARDALGHGGDGPRDPGPCTGSPTFETQS